jgi:hypothetical protein
MTKDDRSLWRHAQETLDRINSGELKATSRETARLQSLLEGQQAWLECNAEQKKGMIGLLYERQLYLSKLRLLDKLGSSNKWNHPMLQQVHTILFEESDEFQLETSVPG